MTEALNMQKRQAKHPSNLIAQNISGELEKKACSVRVNYSSKMLKLLLLFESKMPFKETHFSHLSHMMKKYSCLVRCFCVIMCFVKAMKRSKLKKHRPAKYHLSCNFPVSFLLLPFLNCIQFLTTSNILFILNYT